MNLSLKWLADYVDCGVSVKEFCAGMTMSGSKVETYETEGEVVKNVIVGKLVSITPHENSDHLQVCQVDVGGDSPIQIVTGAQNIVEGALVPVAMIGAELPGGVRIKKGKLRGVESNGMLCSLGELGLTKHDFPYAIEDGIFLIEEDCTVGQDIHEAIGLNDTSVEFEITSNRPDCLSVIGLARETAATFDRPFSVKTPEVKGVGGNINEYMSVEVKDTDLCPRYTARIVKNIKIEPSPAWMRERLHACGVRPINNIVDITNYVMEEYGQPMHAYDYDTLAGHKIVVRRAENGEKFTTLDGQERTMDDSVLMICDGEKAVGIAGIMGGENSMITDNVKTMMFEAACFDGTNIRLSAKKIGLRTDASGKFEKGLDPNNAQAAINRACQLIEELGAGEVVGGMADVYSKRKEPVRVKFEPERINALLGTNLSSEQMLDYLANVELAYDEESNEIIAPTFRHDIFRTADIAEEVARFYGYDNIPTTLPKGEATTGKLQFHHRVENVAKDIAEFCGFSQGMNYSFESPKVFDKLLIPEDSVLRQAIRISNPLGDDFSIMRTTSLNGMLSSLGYNYSHRNKDVRLYELANIYLPKALPLTELPDERMQFTLGMYGSGDFFVMKGVVEEFLEKAGMHKIPQYDPNAGQPSLHPGRQANILYDGEVIGFLGEVHPQVLDNYGIGEKAYVAVLDMPKIVEKASFDRKYEGIAKFPAVNRDISMVVPKEIMVGQIEHMIAQRGGKILEHFELFDIYEGDQIERGFKSVAYSLTFRSKEKTLEEAEINGAMNKILNGLEGMGIQLRK